MTSEEPSAFYAGLSGLDLGDRSFELGKGLTLTSTYAHVMSHVMMAFKRPPPTGGIHPGPWKGTLQGWSFDVYTQLAIPADYKHTGLDHFQVATAIVGLLRLRTDPEIRLAVVSGHPIADLVNLPHDTTRAAAAVETQPAHFALRLVDRSNLLDTLPWVIEHWEITADLRARSPEFDLAMSVFEAGQFISNTAMTLVSIWGALEAIFSPSMSELRYRVSSAIAAYLVPPGQDRLDTQRRVAKLYDKRSAAAHGKPNHAADDLLQSYHLLREILQKMIEQKKVPSREDLDALLFCA